MGRRRRRVVKVVKRTLPKVFNCPNCGMVSVRVSIKNGENPSVVCGSCGLEWRNSSKAKMEPIDVYNMFVDQFMRGEIKS